MQRFARVAAIAQSSVLVMATILGVASSSVSAAATGSLYSYDLQNVVNGSVTNEAVANTTTPLNLYGDWSAQPNGVQFNGNTVDSQSVGYANPVSGPTLSVPASQSLSFGARVFYPGPPSGNCNPDTQNVVQIGRSADYAAQAKIQLSNCHTSKVNVFPECRVAGANTPQSVSPVTSSVALQPGEEYLISCTKSPDVGPNANIALSVTKIDPVNGNQTTTDTFTVAAIGLMNASNYLSVGNKYPLPSISKNTDQFTGLVNKIAYCGGADVVASQQCLNSELPLASNPVLPPAPVTTATVTYSDGVTQVTNGDMLNYTATITNNSSTTSLNNTALIASLPAGTTFVSADDGIAPVYQQLTWNIGTIPARATVTKHFTLTASSLIDGQQVNSAASFTDSDNVCANTGSVCAVTDTDTAYIAPQILEYVTNQSVETDITGWNAAYNGMTSVMQASEGYDGSHSVRATRTGSAGPTGFNGGKPRAVSSTVAGKVYTGSVWAKAHTAGTTLSMVLKEYSASGGVAQSTTVSITPNDTDWHEITTSITASTNGNGISFNVFSDSVAANDWIEGDMMSITSAP